MSANIDSAVKRILYHITKQFGKTNNHTLVSNLLFRPISLIC